MPLPGTPAVIAPPNTATPEYPAPYQRQNIGLGSTFFNPQTGLSAVYLRSQKDVAPSAPWAQPSVETLAAADSIPGAGGLSAKSSPVGGLSPGGMPVQ